MKKVSTAVAKQNRNISQQKLTIGLDLGDRNSWYCVMDETGHIQLEQRVRTTAKALREVFGVMPRSLDIVTTAQACLVSRFEWRCRNRNRSATEMEKTVLHKNL